MAAGIKVRKGERRLILEQFKGGRLLTVKEVSDLTGLPSERVLQHIIGLRRSGIVTEEKEERGEYLYKLAKEKVDMAML